MKLEGRRKSSNVDDRRGRRSTGGGIKLSGGMIVLILIAAVIFKKNPLALLEQTGALSQGSSEVGETGPLSEEQRKMGDFAAIILASTEDVWAKEFREMGMVYEPPTMVLFTDATDSGCGFASAQTGPFYCPADRDVYLDLSFFDEMSRRFHAPGDFAQAYVIAHEVGHHVQNLLGISDQVHSAQQRSDPTAANRLSVRLELQADFLAGMWARHDQERFGSLEEGDIDEAMRAANAIGDDTLQKQAQGKVVPDSFTHGTSEQRMRWFMKGFRGEPFDPDNTFRAKDL
ncbi:KPN_02809 family neutral zinc metallopeptidase [Haloferula sargassicola]|uniref:Neutral zinc metallopeptidase n=1 Tax=Haloferula sargassicola TaxID=490096 RepID=A0ABP9UK73_9BACT